MTTDAEFYSATPDYVEALPEGVLENLGPMALTHERLEAFSKVGLGRRRLAQAIGTTAYRVSKLRGGEQPTWEEHRQIDDIRCGLGYLLEGGLEPKEAVSTVMSLTETLREDPDEALAQMAAIVEIPYAPPRPQTGRKAGQWRRPQFKLTDR